MASARNGSVGKPKDGDWRAGFVLLGLGPDGVQVDFRRVEYDIEATIRAVMAAALPEDFARFLRTGGAS